jgi:hypothetical protein
MTLRRLLPHPLVLAGTFAAPAASADQPFVDAPLTLPPIHFSGDVGMGFGTYQEANGGSRVGAGSSLALAMGLPFLGEIGARFGYRFGNDGIAADADHFARLFDPIISEPGAQNFANPELYLRGSLVDVNVFALGLETRFIIPSDPNSVFAMTPGVPIRVHIPGFMRIDTGLWLPIAFTQNASYYLDIPAQAFFQIGDAFVGPLTGIRFDNLSGPGSVTVEVPLGVGGGYTIGGVLDLKAQLRTEHINSSAWAAEGLGGSVGVGFRLP